MSASDAGKATNEEHAMRGLRFDPTINLGHVLTAATFLVVGTAGYVALDGRVGHLERSYREEQSVRQSADNGIESRLLREITTQRATMDQTQVRVADDIREIKTLMRDGFRDLDAKLDKKSDKPGR
jgi:hypothetical protein